VADIHRAYLEGVISCGELVHCYLARIEAYDRSGPALNAVVALDPSAADQARACDQVLRHQGGLRGALFGIPVLVKDQIMTKGLTTTFGSVAFEGYVPPTDATVVGKLRRAGAVLLGKTLLPDFASLWFGFSSAGGEARNPYDPDRDPGGSSSGTAAAVAANLAAVGIGGDTGGSVRVPSSFNNLVGVRVTTGLISRAGMSALVGRYDTPGPITRTVQDAAVLLDALVGYDPADPATVAAARAPRTHRYCDDLVPGGLRGARIGVLRSAFGAGERHTAPVDEVVEEAVLAMARAGAGVVDPLVVADLDELVAATSLFLLRSKHDVDDFLRSLPGAPVRSVEALRDSGRYHPLADWFEEVAARPAVADDDPRYLEALSEVPVLRHAVLHAMEEADVEAVVYPTVRIAPPPQAEVRDRTWTNHNFPTNTPLASQLGFPAMSVPAGFTKSGLPVNLEILGPPLSEHRLIRLAYSFEQSGHRRLPPATTPRLPGAEP
jgi:amidase